MKSKTAASRPHFSAEEALSLARNLYGLQWNCAQELPSERDQNFLLKGSIAGSKDAIFSQIDGPDGEQRVSTGERNRNLNLLPDRVLKISNAEESVEILDMQNRVLQHIHVADASILCPLVVKTLHGELIGHATRQQLEKLEGVNPPTAQEESPDANQRQHLVRLLTYLDGLPLAKSKPQNSDTLFKLGKSVGKLTSALAGFEHSAAEREFLWKLEDSVATVNRLVDEIGIEERRTMVARLTNWFSSELVPLFPKLRRSVIHGDCNHYNIIVSGERLAEQEGGGVEWPQIGIIDFGDMVCSFTAAEVAVVIAYVMLDKEDPLAAAASVLAGYHTVFPLTEEEVEAVYGLAVMRLCLSVSIGTHQQAREPGNAYLGISQSPAWSLLSKLGGISPRFAHYCFRHACGLPPHPRGPAVASWLRANQVGLTGIVGPPKEFGRVQHKLLTVDFSPGSTQMVAEEHDWISHPDRWEAWIQPQMASAGATIAFGRYGEPRMIYTDSAYESPSDGMPERRSVHLGVDLFLPAGSPLYVPVEGIVHSFRNNAQPQDYGPCLILEHRIVAPRSSSAVSGHHRGPDKDPQENVSDAQSPALDRSGEATTGQVVAAGHADECLAEGEELRAPESCGGGAPGISSREEVGNVEEKLEREGEIVFYTLYGHLSCESLEGMSVGKRLKKGEVFAQLGSPDVNGGWAPHVHFQVVVDMLGYEGDYPGAATPSSLGVWTSLCPDPNLLLGIPEADFPEPKLDADAILGMRSKYIGANLSVAYAPRRPLHIISGHRQFLYDAMGRAYLDATNNVAHVGHCHPAVVAAAQRHMAVLNTNTRYLHENLVKYAARLCATLPDPLSIVFFTCTGSEANDLALRIARAHTRRKGVITLAGAYHGHTQALIDVSPYKHSGPGGLGPPPHVRTVPMPDPYRGPYRVPYPNLGRAYAALVKESLQRRGGGEGGGGEGEQTPAPGKDHKFTREVVKAGEECLPGEEDEGVGAFICESVLGCGGQIVLPEGYLSEVYRHVREAGGVCIADEVQVGFGRTGSHFWGFETQGVVPDVVTMGKPIGNGHPIGAVVTTPALAASFANGMEYFNTFGGNPVSCAVGLAVLDVIESEGLQAHAKETGDKLLQGLKSLMERHPLIGDVRGLGLFVGVELVLDRHAARAPAPRHAAYVADRMAELGVLLGTDGPYHNVLKIKPPMVFDGVDADRLVATLDRVLQDDVLQLP